MYSFGNSFSENDTKFYKCPQITQKNFGISEGIVWWSYRKNIRYANNPRYDIKIIWNFRSSTKMNFTCFIIMIYHEVDLQFKSNASD